MSRQKQVYLQGSSVSVMLKAENSEVKVPSNQPISRKEVVRVGKFGAVGVFNTTIDFGLYNILSSGVGLSLIQSNIISTSIAMVFSFLANKNLVFKQDQGSVHKQAIIFLVVTAFGLYVIQTGTIHLLTEVWLMPLTFFLGIAHMFHITSHDQFLAKNIVKALATILSLTWNYLMYKKVVFS